MLGGSLFLLPPVPPSTQTLASFAQPGWRTSPNVSELVARWLPQHFVRTVGFGRLPLLAMCSSVFCVGNDCSREIAFRWRIFGCFARALSDHPGGGFNEISTTCNTLLSGCFSQAAKFIPSARC
jgi:hypothetical protein